MTPQEVSATVHAVMEKLNFALPYRLVWQSKLNLGCWMGQDIASALRGLARLGQKHAVIVPIGFTSEHIETLHELDIEYCSDLAREVGMVSIRRASAPNDHPLFIQVCLSSVHFSCLIEQMECGFYRTPLNGESPSLRQ